MTVCFNAEQTGSNNALGVFTQQVKPAEAAVKADLDHLDKGFVSHFTQATEQADTAYSTAFDAASATTTVLALVLALILGT